MVAEERRKMERVVIGGEDGESVVFPREAVWMICPVFRDVLERHALLMVGRD